uniref:Cytochrome b561 domain-containing protein n=1 Tax=Steinernema glaseri TaxID=37863 RepID=A0A1I7YEF8_9BILA
MGAEFLRTPPGLLYIIQLVLGVVASFIAQFIWENGSVYISLIVSGHGMQTYVYFAIFITTLATLVIIFMEINQSGSVDSFGKIKVIIFHVICGVLMLIAACMESYYVSQFSWWRYPFVMILLWVLTLSHIAQIVLLFLYK